MKSEPILTVPFIPSSPAEGAEKRKSYTGRASPLLALAMLALSAATQAFAADKKPAMATADEPAARVSGVTVTASRTVPRVQSTFPAAGARITPGLLVLRVTYDTKMRPDGWSYAREKGAEYPDCAESPRLLDDGRSFVLICRTLPGKRYSVWFNRPPLGDFASMGRRPAVPFELSFATTDEEPIRTLPEAMKADPALSNVANPVEPDGLAVYGQDHDAPGD